MITLKVNGVDLYKDYGIVLESFNIEMPEANIERIKIPGRDGEIDISDALTGYVTYNNRNIELIFGVTGKEEETLKKRNILYNKMSGKKVKLELSHLPGYFNGRAVIEETVRNNMQYQIKVGVNCDPYRYENEEYKVSKSLTAGKEEVVDCINLMMPAFPVIKCSGNIALKYKNKSYTFPAGEHIVDFFFEEGENKLVLKGEGNVEIRYQRGEI